MWFQCSAYDGFYYLTTPDERDAGQGLPRRLPANAPIREPDPEDWLWDVFSTRSADNLNIVSFRWICNETVDNGIETKVEFPKLVTIQNLAAFFKKVSEKSTSIKLDSSTTVHRNGDFSGYSMSVKGNRLIGWSEDRLYWYRHGNLNALEVEALNKYLGKSWKLVGKDGMVGLANEKGEWFFASEYAHFTLDGRQVNQDYIKEVLNPAVTSYLTLVKNINQYVDSITPAKIREVTEGMSPTTHSISTRCEGCQACSGIHLETHVIRGEIDPYLIFSAYDAFGSELFGGALRQTWDLIADPSSANVAILQGHLRNFLLDSLRSKVAEVTYLPLPRRQGSTAWRLYSANRFRIDSGNRLVPGREEERVMRDGEYLAREIQQAERQRERIRDPLNLDDLRINEMAQRLFRRERQPALRAGLVPAMPVEAPLPDDNYLDIDDIGEDEF